MDQNLNPAGDAAREEKPAKETNVYELVQTLRRELPEIDKESCVPSSATS